ncbi:hypothetical protein [Acinetobacter faecalis]|uniref:hypothetical protein n=1 Tax=Acinetobacter faecalis TaxID=2665161 RepID=UPI002A91590C|nr:hypothetical protein [Acinetobacter faecalis]MDY6457165.1 hypothetical protein [Acinetobacter faecalis]
MTITASDSLQNIVIYTNNKISLDFYKPFEDGLNPILFTVKTLEQIPRKTENKIHIVILESCDELSNLQINCNKIHLIMPTCSKNKLENDLHALIFKYEQSMTSQQALENLYHSFIKFYCSAEYYLDPQDFFNSDSYKNGHRYLKIHDILQNTAGYEKQLNTYLKTISDTETVCFNFSISYDFPSESGYLPLLEDTVDHLTYARNRDVFFSIVLSKHPISDNKLSIVHLSQESPMS